MGIFSESTSLLREVSAKRRANPRDAERSDGGNQVFACQWLSWLAAASVKRISVTFVFGGPGHPSSQHDFGTDVLTSRPRTFFARLRTSTSSSSAESWAWPCFTALPVKPYREVVASPTPRSVHLGCRPRRQRFRCATMDVWVARRSITIGRKGQCGSA